MKYIEMYFSEFWILSVEMAPYLLLGFLIAGILKVYVKTQAIQKHLGSSSSLKSSVRAALLGVPLPLCSCGVIPTAVSLYREGASRSATVSFLISTPQTGVDSILATGSLLGWVMAVIRPITAFITGVVGGILVGKQPSHKPTIQPESSCQVPSSQPSLIRVFHYAFVDFLGDIAKWLLFGIAVAALFNVVVPADFFINYITSPYLSMLIVLLLSVPLYVCATGSIPIAAVLMMKGLSPGAALVFLMAGPATNIATITVLLKVLGRKTTMIYLAAIIFGAIFFGLLIDMVLPVNWLSAISVQSSCHTEQGFMYWVGIISALLLLSLIAYSFIRRKNTKQVNSTDLVFRVEGMMCNHCKNSVEVRLTKVKNVESVKVDLINKLVTVKAKNVDPTILKEAIQELGYRVRD